MLQGCILQIKTDVCVCALTLKNNAFLRGMHQETYHVYAYKLNFDMKFPHLKCCLMNSGVLMSTCYYS